MELNDLVVENLSKKFKGKIPLYVATVKFDLEARDRIEQVPKTNAYELRLCKI